jgi:Family of unknown function (DUF6085)
MRDVDRVQGCCPMGCGETLFLGSGGYVTCSLDLCPAPDAASRLLATRETDHLVEIGADGFNVQHPLRERLDGALFGCDLHIRLTALDGPPLKPGRYRVRVSDDRGSGMEFVPVPGDDS